jgi:hypothetical protein
MATAGPECSSPPWLAAQAFVNVVLAPKTGAADRCARRCCFPATRRLKASSRHLGSPRQSLSGNRPGLPPSPPSRFPERLSPKCLRLIPNRSASLKSGSRHEGTLEDVTTRPAFFAVLLTFNPVASNWHGACDRWLARTVGVISPKISPDSCNNAAVRCLMTRLAASQL